jgi:probable F420-dependent oxidoreductase
VKFGFNIINFGHGATPESLKREALWAESVGFQLVMVSDHVAITPDVARSYPAPFYEPFTTLAWLAGITNQIELGTTVVIVPYRHPLETARMAAQVDQFSNGRLIFGVGVGWAKAEFEVLGMAHQRRGRITNDYLNAIKTHWTEDTATFVSPSVSFSDVQTGPSPRQKPHPPIWVGGNTEAAVRRAGRIGDAWHPLGVRLDWVKQTALPLLRQTAEAGGRRPPDFAPRIKLRLTSEPLDDAERRPGQGTLDQIRADLAAIQELGATYVVFDTYLGKPEELLDQSPVQRLLDTLIEKVVDLPGQRVR